MSKVDRFKQEEIKTFSLPRNEVKVVGQAAPVESTEIHFPGYEPVKAQQKADLLQQDEIHVTGRVEVGSKTFNINDLIKRGLFDAAEYFLGRPLTPIERLEGIMSQEELRKYQEAEKKKQTEKNVLDALSKLVDNTKKEAEKNGLRLRGAAEHEDDEDEDDIKSLRVRVRDGEEKENDDFEVNELIWDQKIKERFIDLHGEDAFDLQSHTDMSEWTDEMLRRYRQLEFGESPAPNKEELLEELEELESQKQPQGGKYKGPLEEIIPKYNPDKSYTIAEAKAMLSQMRLENPDMKPEKGAKDKPVLFQPLPSKVADWQQRLRAANMEIVKFRQENPKVFPQGASAPRPIVAEGVAAVPGGKTGQHKAIEWAPFGPKWLVSPQRLREDDVLAIVKASNKQKTPKHPNRTVSAAMKVCLLAYLNGEPMPLELLSAEEKEWLKWLMHEADIEHIKKAPQPLEIKRTPKQIKERLAVLYGEIAEGPNDNPLIKKEFRTLFNKANLMGLLTENQIMNMQDFMKTF